MGGGVKGKGSCERDGAKLAARFIRDVSVFDGTQVAPGTTFTKIWKIKNVGEVAWPAGTRMLFVGGDQMTTEMSVPIDRDSPVTPGEEVDVAVEMTAPAELGRYLGYWRLTGPHCRRKWGQRVWCHVQVVDPSQPVGAVDVENAMEELEKMKSKLPVEEGEEEYLDEPASAGVGVSASQDALADCGADGDVPMDEPETAEPAQTVKVSAALANTTTNATDKTDTTVEDDAVLVTEKMVVEAQPEKMAVEAQPTPDLVSPPPLTGLALVKASLHSMGFVDPTMVEGVLTKNGDDLDACVRDLAAASEWDSLLDDLAEMGFEDRELNKTLMLKNSGNVKRTVKDLVGA